MSTQFRASAGPARDCLRSAGWTPDPPGPAGEIWRSGGASVAVPRQHRQGSGEWHGVIDRVEAAVFEAGGVPAGLYLCVRCQAAPATLVLATGTNQGTSLVLLCQNGAPVRLLALTEVPA